MKHPTTPEEWEAWHDDQVAAAEPDRPDRRTACRPRRKHWNDRLAWRKLPDRIAEAEPAPIGRLLVFCKILDFGVSRPRIPGSMFHVGYETQTTKQGAKTMITTTNEARSNQIAVLESELASLEAMLAGRVALLNMGRVIAPRAMGELGWKIACVAAQIETLKASI